MKLAGRVEESGAESQGSGHARNPPQRLPQGKKFLRVFFARVDVCLDGHVAIVLRRDKFLEFLGRPYIRVARKNETVMEKIALGRFQFAFLEVALQEFSRENLGRFHVRLIERVYSHDASGQSDRELEPEKLRPDLVRIAHGYFREGNPRVPKARGRGFHGRVSPFVEKHEHRIVPEAGGIDVPLVEHRQDPDAVFARALGYQLLRPAAEGKKPVRENEAQLVPPLPGERPEKRPEAHARVFAVFPRPRGSGFQQNGARGLEDFSHVHSREGGGRQSEIRKRAEPPADVRVVQKHFGEPVLPGRLRQSRARVRDADEVLSRIRFFPQEFAVEILHQGGGFDRRARL